MSINEKKHLLLSMMKSYAKNNPYAVFSYTNAAVLYGTPTLESIKLEIHTVQPSKKFVNRKAITHIYPYFSQKKIDGFRVVTLVDLLLEISVHGTALSAITAISYHLFKNDIEKTTLLEYCQANKWKSGVARLKHFLRFASKLDESPFETKVRLKLYEAGLINPEQQYQIFCQNNKCYRVDFLFSFQGRKVILEADGLVKYSQNTNVRSAERQRESDLVRAGYEILRVMNSDFDNGRFTQLIKDYGIPKRRYFGRKIVKKHYS